MISAPVHQIVMPTPYAVGPVNAYLLLAEPLTLIDAGINTAEGKEALLAGIAKAGVELGEVRRVLITHAHPDHYGLVHLFQENPNTQIFFPAKEISRIRDRQMLFDVARLLIEAGMPMELLEQMNEQRKSGPRPGIDHDNVIPLHDGDRFAFEAGESFELTALHMPGHTGGHMVFHEPTSRTLFAGDQLLPDVSPNPLIEPSLDSPGERRRSLKEYLHSLERMSEMDLSLAYPGHGAPIEDPPTLVTSTIEHHLKRKVEVANRLSEEGRTPYDLSKEMYPRVKGYDIFLAVSEVVAHLDLVVEDGGAHVDSRDGVTFYLAGPPA